MKRVLCALLSVCLATPNSQAQNSDLNELALFYRCFAHLTQLRPTKSDPLLAQVKAGTKTAVQACTEILDKAKLTADGGTRIGNEADPVAKAVLNSMHQLHRTWSREKALFSPLTGGEEPSTEAWFEYNPLGSYFTRALFSPNYDVLSIVQGNDYPQTIRTNLAPVPPYRGIPSATAGRETEFYLGADQPFAPRGELFGVRTVSRPPVVVFGATRFTDLRSMPDFPNIGVAPKASQAISSINFADVTATKGPLAETEQFAIQIKGKLNISTAATYRLFLSADDAGTLFVDGARLIERTSTGETGVDIALGAGSHDIIVQFRQRTTTARLILSWQSPTITKQAIPASAYSGLTADYYTESQPIPVQLTANEGGGFVGNHNYLMTTFLEADRAYVPNGAEKTNRSWARAVLRDAFCRDIPVVRDSDVEQFVVPDSTTPFRTAAACTACHASVDRQAGLIRGLRWNAIPTQQNTSPVPDKIGIVSMKYLKPFLPESRDWPHLADPEYVNRSPFGHLYFRNYKGELVDRELRSLAELGTAISQQDDFYACISKRYYQYFTGISVELSDSGSSVYPKLNAAELYHRTKVIDLGQRLKTHKSLRQLVLDILSSKEYRMRDFGISYQGP